MRTEAVVKPRNLDTDIGEGLRQSWHIKRSITHVRPILQLTDEDGDDVGIQKESDD
jgi:hypothetical protein